MKKVNPHEELVEELAALYPDLVMEMVKEVAPHRPWWSMELSTEQQLWRYMDIREDTIGWLLDLSAFFGWVTVEDMINGIKTITTERIEDIVPPELLVDERGDALKELVQMAGPEEAMRHIRRMEIEALKRERGLALLQPDPVDIVPELPPAPDDTGSVFVPTVIG